ncbi:MAG: transcription-repair coupling factor [Candidatus Krumholzibacteriia bacterium]
MLEPIQKPDHSTPSALIRRVLAQPPVKQIIRAADRGARRIDVRGLRGSSPALVLEALRTSLGRPVVVCCADAEKAQDACSDLKTVSTAGVRLFPEKDIFPQRFEIKENLTIRGRRNACLDLILRDDVDIVVTSLPGFLEKTVPVDVFTRSTRDLRLGERLDLEALREYLVSVGYEAVATVEELGQFAVRGAIVDVFDPSWAHPARLEFLDDELVSIRTFDIDSQASIDSAESVRVLPAAGVRVNEQTMSELERNLREASLDAAVIDEIRTEIEHHHFSYLLRRYAPAMGVSAGLLDFFQEMPLLFFWDEEGLGRALNELKEAFEKTSKLTEPEYPFLELDEYIHAPDYYTSFDMTHIHLWMMQKSDASPPPAKDDAITFRTAEHPTVLGKFDSLVKTIRRLYESKVDIQIFSESDTQRERLADMLEESEEMVHLPVGWISSGFLWEGAGLAVLTDHQIFHRALPRPADRRKTHRSQGYRHEHLQAGDFVVHVDYGIGRYVGLEKVSVYGGETECLSLRYDGGDRIFVPLDQMPLVEKYVGKEGGVPKLDRLGSARWQRTKARTRKALEDVAREMLTAYAEREIAPGNAFAVDSQWQKEIEASFPFEETPDQLRTAAEIKADMQVPRPMDRLICGDVGFGKTEVALRAAFKAVDGGKQVAVLVPTTILAMQHYRTFRERMGAFPLRVEMLSRFQSPAQQKEILAALQEGAVDIVIGTHRLLSKDIAFHDIGLLIIDEEHRFGVRSKEKLKLLRKSVDVLSMTATPIPRTLYMALSGLRPISVIDTPPRNRHPVRTEVLPFDEDVIVRAISTEVARRGQVFFVHNRVGSIYSMQAFLERLLPDVKVTVAHGQMGEKELEGAILSFLDRKCDVLLCTTIIESGLDFPNVNTIIINRADRFGLAELYQLRGRVGRRERQAFAYLLVPRNFAITRDASRRLQAMEEFEELGSGYRLAMRDLEIRGAGNVLGVEQHGQLLAVGFELYCRMLRDAVRGLQGEAEEETPPCRIETRRACFLPESYVEDQDERMTLYRRLARLTDPAEVDRLQDEIGDRFGPMPTEAINLIEITRLKVHGAMLGVRLIQFKPERLVIEFLEGKSLEPRLCARLVETFEGRVLFKSSGSFGLTLAGGDRGRLFGEAGKLLKIAWEYGTRDNPVPQNRPAAS